MKKSLFSVLLSAAVAFGLWVYVITVIHPGWEQTYTDIPVTIQNEKLLTERGLMIVSNGTPTVSLSLSGNRTDLMEISSSDISVVCNVSSIEAAGEFSLSYTVYYANNAITVLEKKPEAVSLKVEKRITKPVDVEVQYIGDTPTGYIDDRDNIELNHAMVEITGPQSMVEDIQCAQIQIDLRGKTQLISGSFDYVLLDGDGEKVESPHIETNVHSIDVLLRVLRLKELPILVEVINGGGATLDTSEITWDPLQIMVSGNEAALEGLEQLIVGTVDLGKILQDQTLEFPIELPEGINNVTGITTVQVNIAFPNLDSKTLQVANIRPVNVPQGLDVEIGNKVVEITFRGPAEDIALLTAEDVILEVDIADMQLGSASVKPNVIVSRFPNVGAVGNVSNIVVWLQETPPEE